MALPSKFPVAADPIIVDNPKKPKNVVLIKRKNPPFQDKLAFPGGFMEENETIEQCCVREAEEETSLKVEIVRLVGVYTAVNRDPRGRTVSATYLCKPIGGTLKASSDAAAATWYPVKQLKAIEFAFDHRQMLEDAGILKKSS